MTLGVLGSDLWWLAAAAFAAGLVRGFAGFGTAMIYLPVAGQILSPFAALTTLVIMDLVAPLPNVPRALRDAHRDDLLRLGAGLLVGLPFGLYALTLVAPEVFRYAVSLITFVLLASLVGGLRYQGTLSPRMVLGTGGISGLLMGVAGLPGPPVILLYMASAHAARVIRANTLLYLVMTDIVFLPMLALFGRLEGSAVVLGLGMIVPSLLGNVAGGWLFRPGYERVYRAIAYCIIGTSALSGLPLWD